MKRFLKRTMTFLLAFGMIFSEPLPAYSAVVVDKGSKGHQGEIIENEEALTLEAEGEELKEEELTGSEALSSEPDSEEAVEKEPETSEEEEALEPDKTGENQKAYGHRPGSEEEAKVSRNAEEEESLSEELPAKYDLRELGLSTSVKDQNPFGTCWAFGTMAASESNSIKNKLVGSDVDFAERHLAYYLFSNYNYLEDGVTRQGVDDPLGNTAGDFAVYEYENKSVYDPGLNTIKAMFYLLGWRGPANEADYPYKNSKEMDTEKLPRDTENIYGKSQVHLQDFGVINIKKQPEKVKEYLQKYGVLAVSYYDDDNSYGENGCYYCSKNEDSNHTVAIVGWDDNKVIGKNKYGKQPEKNGAWIIKNSWGTNPEYLDNGYMYISYEDTTLVNAVYCQYEKKDNYDNNYFYSGGVNNESYDKANSYANIYEIKKGNEILKACGIALKDPDVNYELQIYKNPTDATDPESGEKMLSEPLTGKTTFEGYYTVNLNVPLIFAKGDKVAVVFYLSKGDSIISSENVDVYVDNSTDLNPGEDSEQYYTKEERCQSLYSSKTKNDKGDYDGEWNDFIDITPHPDTARIHAYTVNTTWGLDYTGIDCSTLNLTTGQSYQLKLAEGSTVSLTDLNFETSEASVATVSADGKISAVGAGEADITISDKNDENKYQYVYVNVQTDFSDAKVSFKDGVSSFTYTGKAIEPEVVVTVRDKQLVKDTDYKVSYENNINTGSFPVAIVTGIGSYKDSGSKRLSFTIEKKSFDSKDITLELEYTNINYLGKERKPWAYLKDGDSYLKAGKDYDVAYSNNIEISTDSEIKPEVTVSGKGNYSGTLTAAFEIEKAPFALWVDGAENSKYFAETFTYTGSKIEPSDIDVYWYNTKLTKDTDYTLKYANNLNVYDIEKSDKNDKKAPAIIISGKGDYSGNSTRILFTIKAATLESSFSSPVYLQYKAGKVQKGKTKVSFVSDYEDLYVLKENKDYKIDYDNAYAVDEDGNKIEDFKGVLLQDTGIYYVPLKGIGNFANDEGKSYFFEYIQEEKESPASLNISKAKFSFEDGSETITKNWSGKWKYMTLADDNYKLTYDKDGKEVTLKEYKEGETLSDCDYIVSYKNNNKAGKASIIFTGINDYSGKLTKTFTITKGKLGEKDSTGGAYSIAGVETTQIYLKNGVYPEFKVNYTTQDGTIYTLMEGRDYTVKYKNNKELCDEKKLKDESAIVPTIIVTGKGNFEGTVEEIFAITGSDLSRLSGYGYATDIKYANKPFSKLQKPSVFIYDLDGKALKAGTDYEKEIEYYYDEDVEITVYGSDEKVTRTVDSKVQDTDVIPAGTRLYANVKGKNNYAGSEEDSVSSINLDFCCYDPKADISKAVVTLNDKGKEAINKSIGKAITLENDQIDVKLNGSALQNDNSDYTITCVIDNSNSGKMTSIIKGCGDYAGVKKFTVDLRAGKQK